MSLSGGGDQAGQPSLSAGDLVGIEVLDPTPFTSSREPLCPSGYYCRYSDAALFRYNASVTATYRAMAIESGGSVTQLSVPGKLYAFPVGTTVTKTGWATGTTSGVVTQTCIDINHPISYSGSPVRLICQDAADYLSDGGDSGSPVYVNWYGMISAAGIHWARNDVTGERYMSRMYGLEVDAPLSFIVVLHN